MKPLEIIPVRIVMIFLTILLVHWVDHFVPLYFIVVAGGAGIMLLSRAKALPGLDFLDRLETSDRLAIWIILVVLFLIGYLHNANTWMPEGSFLKHAQNTSFWKTELILAVSLVAPAVHWLVGMLLPRITTMNGQRFATEFALYVNFSGIALVLWTGEATFSDSMLGAAFVLVVLAELTLYASRSDQ